MDQRSGSFTHSSGANPINSSIWGPMNRVVARSSSSSMYATAGMLSTSERYPASASSSLCSDAFRAVQSKTTPCQKSGRS